MPLRAAQLFVRCSSLDELGEALGRALRRIPNPDPARQLVALHESGWATLVDGHSLAGPLSERFGTALALELDGGELALRVQTWEAGQAGEEERDPAPPHFRDVEAAAWELLQYLGVPPGLRLLALDGLEVLDEGAALPALLARGAEVTRVSVLPPLRTEGAPPAEPDVVVESTAGEARALEVRVLPEGIPTEAWAEALAEVEEAQARRLLRSLCDADEPRMPRPAFAYRSLQPLRVDKLMAKARRARPWLWRLLDPERDAPLTRAGFTELCRTRMAGLRVARAHGRHLELWAGEACVRAPVDSAYEACLATLDPDAAAAQAADEARALVQAAPAPPAAAHLLPTLLAGDPGPRAAGPIAPGVSAALLADDGARIAPVLESELRALNLDFDEALAIALQRADALMAAAPAAVRWIDLEHGRVVTCDFDDACGAGRLLSQHAREILLTVLGQKEALAAAPTRDALLACGAHDAEGAAWLREEARRRWQEGPFPIDPSLWRIGPDTLALVAEPAPRASPDREGPTG